MWRTIREDFYKAVEEGGVEIADPYDAPPECRIDAKWARDAFVWLSPRRGWLPQLKPVPIPPNGMGWKTLLVPAPITFEAICLYAERAGIDDSETFALLVRFIDAQDTEYRQTVIDKFNEGS